MAKERAREKEEREQAGEEREMAKERTREEKAREQEGEVEEGRR